MKSRFSVIIPVEKFTPEIAVLKSLQFAGLDSSIDEILVAEGRSPSRQRNQAVLESKGEILVFLDADVNVPSDYFKRLAESFEKPTRLIVGGPVLLPAKHSEMEEVAQALFANPWLMGKSASRYQSVGLVRECDQAELILCNLSTTRAVWNELGGLNESLYPNEENEWLDRAESRGVRLIHNPTFFVHRPQRESYRELLGTFYKYGRGRGEQTIVAGKVSWLHFVPALAIPLFGTLFWIFGFGTAYSFFSTPTVLYMVAVMATLFWKNLAWQNAFFGGVIAPLLMVCYGCGTWSGLFQGLSKARRGDQLGLVGEVKVIHFLL